MRTEAEIRQEIARLESLAESEYAEGRKVNGSSYWSGANRLRWVLENKADF